MEGVKPGLTLGTVPKEEHAVTGHVFQNIFILFSFSQNV
jgi:hypothetical protein